MEAPRHSSITASDCGFDGFSQWRARRLSQWHLNICSIKLGTLSGTSLCPQHLQESLGFGRCSVNICLSNKCLLIHTALCWLDQFFYQTFPPLILLSEIYDYFCNLIIMGILKEANMCFFTGVLMKEWGNCFEGGNLSGSGMQVSEIKIQVSMEGVIRSSLDAEPMLQFV